MNIIKTEFISEAAFSARGKWISVRIYDDYQSAQNTTMKAELPVKQLMCSN